MTSIKILLISIALVSTFAFSAVAETLPGAYCPELVALAESGNVAAQTRLAICYEEGVEVPVNLEEAVKWYHKAAEQGDARAQCNLGLCYLNGKGVNRNYQEAVKWLRKGAEQGHADAQNNLGYCYKDGYGVFRNYQEAFKLFKSAAEQGNSYAQFNLAVCYGNGQGTPRDNGEAMKWCHRAAENGSYRAAYLLGVIYYDGQDFQSYNYDEAFKYFSKVLKYTDVPTDVLSSTYQYLAKCFRFGRGVETDIDKANEYNAKAAELGEADSRKIMEWLQMGLK